MAYLETYPWSSYPCYLGKRRPPTWLKPEEVLGQLGGKRNLSARYKAYVEMGIDEELQQFYSKGNQPPYLGSEAFRAWAYSQRQTDEEAVTEQEKYFFRKGIEDIQYQVAKQFEVTVPSLLEARRGVENVPRWVAIYLCQTVGGHRRVDIAKAFGLKRTGSIPTTIAKLKERMAMDGKLRNRVNSAI